MRFRWPSTTRLKRFSTSSLPLIGWIAAIVMLSGAQLLSYVSSARAEEPASKGEPSSGVLTGRFVWPAAPPKPRLLPIPVARRRADGAEAETDDRVEYARMKLVDTALEVGPTRGVRNVVVWLSDKNAPAAKPLPKEAPAGGMQFLRGQFSPRLVALELGRRLEVTNADRFHTNVRWEPLQQAGFNRSLPPATPTESSQFTVELAAERLPTRVQSDIHPWASGWLFPVGHGWFAVSDANGDFRLADVPTGDWEFSAWHERFGLLSTAAWPRGRWRQAIVAGSNTLGEVALRPETELPP